MFKTTFGNYSYQMFKIQLCYIGQKEKNKEKKNNQLLCFKFHKDIDRLMGALPFPENLKVVIG